MTVKRLADSTEVSVGGHTRLRELLHPDRDPVNIRFSLAHVSVPVGEEVTLRRMMTAEVYFVVSGRGLASAAGEESEITAGDCVYFGQGECQNVCNIGDSELVFMCILDTAYCHEDLIVEPMD